MKNIIIILLLSFCGTSAFAQIDAIEKYFDQYMDDENFSVVYVSPKMFKMVSKVLDEESNKEVTDVVKDLKGLRILKTSYNSLAFYKEAKSKINTNEYELLMNARDEGQNIEFYTKESGDIINELLLMVGGKEDFILMSFVGNIDLNKVAKLAKALDIDGADYLEKLGDN
jgi:hypothetical protein